MPETLTSATISTRLKSIAELARKAPAMVIRTLAHHIDVSFLREAYRLTRKDGAVGVDGQTADEYASNLDENLHSLLDRFKSGRYRAPAVRRVHIPKGDGRTRPLGIPTFEDKVLQRAVAMVMEAVYEQDFLDCSYGFRPAHSAHQALKALWDGLMKLGGGYVVDADIKSYFDTISHEHLRSFLDQRVTDGVLRRTIGKWLNAGVLEDGRTQRSTEGTPQGGVISPLLANIYLHHVLDRWFVEQVQPRLKGASFLVRYADDFVIVCADERDARRVLAVLPQRFGKYGLTLHPEKTRLVAFRPPGSDDPSGIGSKESFDLLGFTHHWARSRKGRWVVRQKTAKKRFARAVQTVSEWCRTHRHLPISVQRQKLALKLRGHYAYYGLTGNMRALSGFFDTVKQAWKKWLMRRSQRAYLTWQVWDRLLRRYPLPAPTVVHSVYRSAKP